MASAPGVAEPQSAQGSRLEAAMSEAALEEDLRRQCDELECLLRQDPLTFENQALHVQLLQMQDDYKSLLEDFRSMREYFSQQIAQLSSQLEDRAREGVAAESHAECLQDLLQFHEDQGQLAGSYWRAQCEKRDDSIRFLALKLQEHTVPSAEYRARHALDTGGDGPVAEKATPTTATPPLSPPPVESRSLSSPAAAAPQLLPPGHQGEQASPPQAPTPRRDYQALLDGHQEICREVQEQEEEGRRLESELEACQLSSAALRSVHELWAEAQHGGEDVVVREEAEAEIREVEVEVAECEQALAHHCVKDAVLPWAQRCAWRAKLDIRAGQLERISMQFDSTKRSLDAANEELQWQATSAEALRMRLAEVLRAVKAEEAKAQEFRAEHEQSEGVIQELLERWAEAPGVSDAMPIAGQQAQWLMEKFHHDEARAASTAVSTRPRSPTRGARGLPASSISRALPPWPPPPPPTWTSAGLLGR